MGSIKGWTKRAFEAVGRWERVAGIAALLVVAGLAVYNRWEAVQLRGEVRAEQKRIMHRMGEIQTTQEKILEELQALSRR